MGGLNDEHECFKELRYAPRGFKRFLRYLIADADFGGGVMEERVILPVPQHPAGEGCSPTERGGKPHDLAIVADEVNDRFSTVNQI